MGQTKDEVERLHLHAGLGMPRDPPGRASRCSQRNGSLGLSATDPVIQTRIKRLVMDGPCMLSIPLSFTQNPHSCLEVVGTVSKPCDLTQPSLTLT